MRKYNGLFKIYLIIIFILCTLNSKTALAAKDSKGPGITLQENSTEPVSGKVKITMKAADASGIQSVKWATGKKILSYFKQSGTKLTLNSAGKVSVSISKNGVYTFYAKDKAGNGTIKTFTVTNIDTSLPTVTIKKSTVKATNKSVTLTLSIKDYGLGVTSIKYLTGKKTEADFAKESKSLKFTETKATDEKYNNQYEYSAILKTESNNIFTFLIDDVAGNKALATVTVNNIDKTAPIVKLSYSVMNQTAAVSVNATDKESSIAGIKYLKGKLTDVNSEKWTSGSKDITGSSSFNAKSSGNYSVMVTDEAGNQSIQVVNVVLEFRAVWISYLEFLSYGKDGYSEDKFKAYIDKMFDNVVTLNMNAVVVQVRPFGDAMYTSSYFPWSKYISGTQGLDPGFDPMEYMVEAAHKRGLQFHAWLNPYRVTTASTDYTLLSEDNPARIWHDDNDKSNDRNVLSFNGNLYYNPASKEVQTLITNGIKEIVKNYDVDGIHFDDYFYPVLGTNYKKNFDNIEYNSYVSSCEDNGKNPMTIANWRRNNVNTLVKTVYKSIKTIDSSVQFGISPGGFLDTLLADTGYYVDLKTWLSSDGYIDYICPQIYWTFTNGTYPFDKTLDRWLSYRTSSSVKMYVGIAAYKSGSNLSEDWKNDDEILMNQVIYGRDTGLVDGFVFFRYNFFYDSVTKPGIDNLLEIL